MKKIGFILGIAVIGWGILAFSDNLTTPIYFAVPEGWPKPHYNFKQNPLTEEGFQRFDRAHSKTGGGFGLGLSILSSIDVTKIILESP